MKIEKSGKKSAPPRRQPGQGGRDSETRHINITTSTCANQEIHISQPASVQRARLLSMLRRGPVNTLQGRAVGIMSIAARIFELKAAGNEIITVTLPNRVAKYVLVREAGHDGD